MDRPEGRQMINNKSPERIQRASYSPEHTSKLPPMADNGHIRRTSPKGYTCQPNSNASMKHGSKKIKRQGRVENNPSLRRLSFNQMEMMKQETKLVVLEYLSSLPPEQIKARNKSTSSGSIIRTKARTIHTSARPFTDVIERREQSRRLLRRHSEQYDQRVREKLQTMADPLRKNLSPEILSEIASFDKNNLKGTTRCRKSLHLTLLSGGSPTSDSYPDSPMACVTSRLEEMSEDIMKDYPQLLDEHLSELIEPLDSGKKLTYEEFALVAKSVFEKQLARITGSIWSKVALVFYLVKEVIFSAGLNDLQIELLVDYAVRFVSEHSMSSIRKEGGWVALEFQDGPLMGSQELRGDIYNPLSDANHRDQMNSSSFSINSSNNQSTDEEDGSSFIYLGSVKDVIKGWTAYGAAALAVGIGVAYSYLKQQ